MTIVDWVQLLGVAGILLVFASFIVKKWVWLYSFNMTGAFLLAVYAYLKGDYVFLVVESGIVVFLLARLYNEVKSKKHVQGC